MFKALAAITALLLATAALLTGNGLQGTLLAVRADLEGFDSSLIGVMMAAYFGGFIVGCRINPVLIKSAGHIRAFVALASIASASTLIHPLFVDWIAWSILRGITGFCIAGMIMIIESWLNERATNAERGRLLSVYRIVDLLATMVGNALIATASPLGFELFAITSIMISIALVPVALTRTPAPQPIKTAKLDLGKIYRLSPAAAIVAPVIGLANGAFWAIGPVYAGRLGYPEAIIGAFMSTTILGAAILQWPVGWISDKIDRRIVLALSAVGASLAAFGLSRYGTNSVFLLLSLGALYGAFAMSLTGLTAAHANDHAEPETAVATSGSVLLLNGVGSILGSIAGGLVLSFFTAPAVFVYVSVMMAVVAMLCFIRIIIQPPPGVDMKSPFTPLPRSASPAVFEIGEEQEEGDLVEGDNATAATTP
ncbi:MAG: MFS transporter [Pseudomonadota bacterium]